MDRKQRPVTGPRVIARIDLQTGDLAEQWALMTGLSRALMGAVIVEDSAGLRVEAPAGVTIRTRAVA